MERKEKEVTFLVYDGNREAAVEPFIEIEFRDMQYFGKRIQIGDYLVCKKTGTSPSRVVAAIERKTLPDYAAGFKDGRYANLNKLLGLRKKTGCQLYFVIEGPAFPSPSRKFSRVSYSNILASITLLMVRHGIMIIYSEDQAHTAKRLYDLTRAISVENEIYQYPCQPQEVDAEADETLDIAVPVEVTEKIIESEDDAAIKMWARLRGVSVVLGSILLKAFSVADLVGQKVSVAQIKDMKTVTGRPINKDARESLLAVKASNNEKCKKILSGIKGISPAIAEHLIKSAGGFSRLCSYSTGALSIMRIPQKTREIKLGDPKAKRIHQLLHHVQTRDKTLDEVEPAAETATECETATEPEDATEAGDAMEVEDATEPAVPKIKKYPKLPTRPRPSTLSDEDVQDFLSEL
jgi:ERCC4-type nuclease